MRNLIVKISSASAFIPGDKTRKLVLRDIDLTIPQNAGIALSGANGSGKSSLLNLIHGVLRPCQGGIAWMHNRQWDESAITGQEITALVSPHIQALCQWQRWPVTGLQMIAGGKLGATLASAITPPGNLIEEIATFMQSLEAGHLLDLTLPQLSQGQLRLVLLARAVFRKPRLLLLDEWEDGLDRATKILVEKLLAQLAPQMAMIFTSHRTGNYPDFITRRLFMDNGGLFENAPMHAVRRAEPRSHAARKNPANTTQPPLLRLENVSVYIDRKLVLKNINWTLRQGEQWRIIGANGSGKSTFLRLLAGDELAAAGGRLLHAARNGMEVDTLAEKRRKIVLASDLSQACYGYNLTGLELVLSGIDNSIGIHREFSHDEHERASTLLAAFFSNPDKIASESIRQLSTGQTRRLFLARALMPQPEILLLDEPCTGLDPESRTAYLELLQKLVEGRLSWPAPSIVIATHAEEDVPAFINRVAALADGRLATNMALPA